MNPKSRILLAFYISVVVLIILLLIVCCVLGWTAAFFEWHPTELVTGKVACYKNLVDCSDCNSDINPCPEWSSSTDLQKMVSIDFKLTGTAAACCVTYLTGALIIASLVRQNLEKYRSEFV
eukprot:gene24408-32854_t